MSSLVLQTSRLILTPHTMANAEKMNAWTNDPDLLYLDDDLPEPYRVSPIERTHAFIERNRNPTIDDDTIHWGIHLEDGGELIGYCMAAFIDRFNRKCKFGMTLGEKATWGQGYGTEAAAAVIDFLFRILNLNRIQGEIYDFNERSIRLVESLGFKREGICRQAVLKRGRFADEYVYALLREDWERTVAKDGEI